MRALGFIVFDERWGDVVGLVTRSNSLWKDIPRAGILLRCTREVSAFPTRGAARAAIKRTNQYMRAHNNRKADHEYSVRKVSAAVPPGGAK